jgi:hypothetical protein
VRVRRWSLVLLALAAAVVGTIALVPGIRHRAQRVLLGGGWTARTIDERLAEFGGAAESRLIPRCIAAGVAWPPARATLLALKDARRLELYLPGQAGSPRFVHAWEILAASGGPGPKLREGDGQVPEGIYAVSALNPNSVYHVSLRLDYPNADDRAQGLRDGRSRLGGDIMIHGKAVSIGCLAMGDAAAEELFTLAARCGVANISVLIAPTDLRRRAAPAAKGWVAERYDLLRLAMSALPVLPDDARDP